MKKEKLPHNFASRFKLLKDAHQRYVDWWLPIDVAAGSIMAPNSIQRFCKTLLIYGDKWFDRWFEGVVFTGSKHSFRLKLLECLMLDFCKEGDYKDFCLNSYESRPIYETTRYAVFEKEPRFSVRKDGMVLSEFDTREEAEAAAEKFYGPLHLRENHFIGEVDSFTM